MKIKKEMFAVEMNHIKCLGCNARSFMGRPKFVRTFKQNHTRWCEEHYLEKLKEGAL